MNTEDSDKLKEYRRRIDADEELSAQQFARYQALEAEAARVGTQQGKYYPPLFTPSLISFSCSTLTLFCCLFSALLSINLFVAPVAAGKYDRVLYLLLDNILLQLPNVLTLFLFIIVIYLYLLLHQIPA